MQRLDKFWIEFSADFTTLRGEVNGNHIWFTMHPHEVSRLAKERNWSVLTDIGHRMEVVGDHVSFYDAPAGREMVYQANVTVIQMKIAHQFWAWLAKTREKLEPVLKAPHGYYRRYDEVWAPKHDERVVIKLTDKWRKRFNASHGVGTGYARFALYDDAKKTLVARKEASLLRCLAALARIARNTTVYKWQESKVRLHPDWDGYYFEIVNPNGKVTLNGGVINHGKDKPDWSLHT